MEFPFLYWIAAVVAAIVSVFLLAVRYEKPLNQRSYTSIRRLLALGTFMDAAICLISGICVLRGYNPTLLNHHIVPIVFNMQLSIMAYAMMGLLHLRNIDRFSPWMYYISAVVATAVISVSYLVWGKGEISWAVYADFVANSRFIFWFRTVYVIYILLAFIRTSVHLVRASRLYIRTIKNYFSGEEVVSGRRLAASVYLFIGYFFFSILVFSVPNVYVGLVAELIISCILILFAIMIINLHNIYFSVYPPHNLAQMLLSIEERKNGVVAESKPVEETEMAENAEVVEVKEEVIPKNFVPGGKIEDIIVNWSLRPDKPFVRESLTLLDVAEQTQLSPRLLSEFLNRYYKVNFSTWINTLRVDEVKRLLVEQPKLSLSEISTMVGFSDPASLSKIFKRISNESPSAYKKSILSKCQEMR